MRTRLRNAWVQFIFSTKSNNCSYSYRRYYMSVLQRTQFCEREQSLVSPPTDEVLKKNIDELDEECIYELPTDVTSVTLPLVHKIMEEVEIRSRFHFYVIPKYLSSNDWKTLLELENYKERKNYYIYLYWKQRTQEFKKKKNAERRLLRELERKTSKTEDTENNKDRSMIFCMSFLMGFKKRNQKLRVMKTAIFGPHIVIDCGYESYMVNSELNSCVRQLAMLRKANLEFLHPFNILHCNVSLGGLIKKLQTEFVPDCMDPASVFHYSEKDYVDLYPREKLVYLSPHSDVELETYDHDSIYVLGAMVDHTPKPGLSVDKASLSGIRSAKLPLERYINWCQGTKCLMFFQVVSILHDLKEGMLWDQIFQKHIPLEKKVFAGPVYREKPAVHSLSIKHIDHLHFVEHHKKNK